MLRNKTNYWGNIIKYDINFSRAEDYKFWVDCSKANLKFANLKVPLISYLQESNEDQTEIKFAQQVRLEWFQYLTKYSLSESLGMLFKRFALKEKMSKIEQNQITEVLESKLIHVPHILDVIKSHIGIIPWYKRIWSRFS